jgi:beta-glucosidase
VRIGGDLPVASTLGRGGRPGNGFETRAPEDLAVLAELGLTDVRIGLDWFRMQPQPGGLDDDWREWYQATIDAARGAGLAVWLTLWDGAVPPWFEDGGGFSDDSTSGRWWPRWVELAADLFGDRVDGWFPMEDPVSHAASFADDALRHRRALTNTVVGWRDAWRILRGGPPVASSLGLRIVPPADGTLPARDAARREDELRWRLWLGAWRDGEIALPGLPVREVQDLAGSLDLLGVGLVRDLGGAESRLGSEPDAAATEWGERVGTMVRRAADEGPERPVLVSSLALRWPDDDDRRLLIEAFGRALVDVTTDGIVIEGAWYSPAIDPTTDRPDRQDGLLDRDRNVRPSAMAWTGLRAAIP